LINYWIDDLNVKDLVTRFWFQCRDCGWLKICLNVWT